MSSSTCYARKAAYTAEANTGDAKLRQVGSAWRSRARLSDKIYDGRLIPTRSFAGLHARIAIQRTPELATLRRSVLRNARCLAAATATTSAQGFAARFVGPRGKVTKSTINQMKLAELKDACQELELDPSGKKPELVERLFEQLLALTADATAAKDSGTRAVAAGDASTALPDPEPSMLNSDAPAEESDVAANNGPADFGVAGLGPEGKETREGVSGRATGPPAHEPAETRTGLSVTWLGSSSGAPTLQRNVSCIALDMGESGTLLVDCGEGSKRQIARAQIDMLKIRHICITHMHGDHCFGLPGVLEAISYAKTGDPSQEQIPLYIYGPPGVFEWVNDSLQTMASELSMRVLVTEFHKSPAHAQKPAPAGPDKKLWFSKVAPDASSMDFAAGVIQQNEAAGGKSLQDEERRKSFGVINGLSWTISIDSKFRVAVAQLVHRVPCFGYCIQEARKAVPADADMLRKNRAIGDPADYEASVPGRKVLLLGDTCDSTSMSHHAMHADLVSHEATFSDGMEHKANIAGHSTSRMAGEFARSISASKLFLTHFSPRFQSNNSETTMNLKKAGKGVTPKSGGLEEGAAEDIDASDIDAIVAQAADGFGCGEVYAVKDFLTHNVAKREARVRRRQ